MVEWEPGSRHPETPKWIFKNVWSRDRLRVVLKSRCALCDVVITSDQQQIKELAIKCGRPECRCRHYLSAQSHDVCSVCYDMWHALYGNYELKNMNYFKEIDEKIAKDKEDGDERRKRMGL